MGGVQSVEIEPKCIPISEKVSDDESPIYRNLHCFVENGGNLIPTYRNQPESRTPIDILKTSSVKWANYDCVGERVINDDGSAGPYRYISYAQFYERCLAFGRGLLELGLQRGDKIGIYSVNSLWWQTAAFGAFSVGIVVVPVYDSLGRDAAKYIINHAEVKLVLVSTFKFKALCELIPDIQENVKKIAVMADVVPKDVESSIETVTCPEVLKLGQESERENEFAKPEDVGVIMYTSGSTGVPKGCVLIHSGIVAGSTGLGCVNMSATPSDTYLSFLPLAHIYALAVELMMYANGVRVAFARGPVKDLMDDIKAMQPTIIVSVPRILNRIAEGMQQKIAALPKPVQWLFDRVIHSKSECVKRNAPHSLLLDILFAKFREALGGRVRLIVNGGAPILEEVFDFLVATVTPNILQGYGLTEVCAGCAVQEFPVRNRATVGASSIACDIKLRKVPDADWDPNGKIPTGELLVRGPLLFKEYYKQPELTNEVLVDGWFATGDVVKITPEGQLQIIDRAKQLVKLSQGEYISLTNLTDEYSMAEIVSFIYVYADPSHDQPLAVVIPRRDKIEEWQSKGITNICESEVVKKEVVDSLLKVATDRKLRGFERITHVIIDTEEPTIDNGLLTPSMKPQYASLRRRYGEQLNSLYRQIEQKKEKEAAAQATPAPTNS